MTSTAYPPLPIIKKMRFWLAFAVGFVGFGYILLWGGLTLRDQYPLQLAGFVLALSIALAWLIWRGVIWHDHLPRTGLEWPLLAGMAAVLLSLAASPDLRQGLTRSGWLLSYVLFFYFFLNLLETDLDRWGLLAAAVTVSGLVLLQGVNDTFQWYRSWFEAAGGFQLPPVQFRFTGLLGNSNITMAMANLFVPVVLLAGTLQPGSARLWPGVRAFFRDLFDRFAHLGVCTAEDRERFVSGLGVRCPVTVTGDTRAEQVILRYEAAADGAVASRLRAWGSTLLVLGSTWPRDERLWLPVLPELLAEFADLRVVLVPHEPLPARLSHLARDLGSRGIASMRLSQLMAGEEQDPEARCVLVDSVGVLAEIYRAGTLAYVGGSFTSGVHNTMEPAICGLPVLFGPVIQNAVEAGILQQKGGGFVLHRPAEAAARTRALLGDRTSLARSGEAARQVVLAQRGATEKSLAVLEPYL